MIDPEEAPQPDDKPTTPKGPAEEKASVSRKTMIEGDAEGPLGSPTPGHPPMSRRTMVEAVENVGLPHDLPSIESPSGVPVGNLRKTILEAVEESPQTENKPGKRIVKQKEQPVSSATRYVPKVRPPMARLSILDDSGTDAEIIRIRVDEFRIGRSMGDLIIPHDAQMSSEHVEISRYLRDKKWYWKLTDLQSTNGTFVRAAESPLQDGQELFLGGRLYRFQQAQVNAPAPAVVDRTKTLIAGEATPTSGSTNSATLTEVKLDGSGQKFPLPDASQWIGRDASLCAIVLDDPMVGDREAKIYRGKDNQWFVKREKSLNGLWIRVTSVPLQGRSSQFQCGEQRFEFRLD